MNILEATSGLLVNLMNTSGMMQIKIIRPFKWDWNCTERLDQTSVQGFRSPVGNEAALHSISVGNHLKAYLAPLRFWCGNAATDVKLLFAPCLFRAHNKTTPSISAQY